MQFNLFESKVQFNLFGYKVSVVKVRRDWPTNWSDARLRKLAQKIDATFDHPPTKVGRIKELRKYMPTKAEPGSDESISNFHEAVALARRMWLDDGYGDVA